MAAVAAAVHCAMVGYGIREPEGAAMAIDPNIVGKTMPAMTAEVERGRLQFFAKAIGEDQPAYFDVAAANAAGHPDLPVPPTFLFGLEMQGPDSFGWLAELDIDLRQVLHGEQSFTYHRMAYAGDRLTFNSRIADVYSKKGGALDFIVRETEVTRDENPVATLRQTIVVRNAEVPA